MANKMQMLNIEDVDVEIQNWAQVRNESAEQISRLEAAGMCDRDIIKRVALKALQRPRPLVEILDELLQEAGDGDQSR